MVSSIAFVSVGPWQRKRVISLRERIDGVEFGIGAGDISAQVDQVFRLPVERERFADLPGVVGLRGRGKAGLQPADGIENLDRRIVSRRLPDRGRE